MKNRSGKIALLAIIVVMVVCFFAFDLKQYLSLDYLKQRQADFQQFYAVNTLATVLIYVTAYVAVAGLSLPGAAIMTIAGGAMFGLGIGTILVSIGSTVGATCAFLVARYLLRDAVQGKVGDKLHVINAGIEREGAFYLFAMRLFPGFPFFVVNLAMGLTPIKTATFFFVSQIGMLPGTIVFVNVGTQLSQIESLAGIVSKEMLFSFALLGLFPLIAKKILGLVKKHRENPSSADKPAA